MTSHVTNNGAGATVSILKDIFSGMSGIAPSAIAADASFLELGADSLLMVQASQAIQDTFQVAIPVRFIIEDNPTIVSLADFIDRELAKVAPPAAAPASPVAPAPAAPAVRAPAAPATAAPAASAASAPAPAPPAARVLADTALPADAMQALFARQLQILTEQLELLRDTAGAPARTARNGTRPAIRPAAPAPELLVPTADAPLAPAPTADAPLAPAPSVAAPPIPAPSATASPSPAPAAPAASIAIAAAPAVVSGQLTARQETHLEALAARYGARTVGSKRLAQRDRATLADSNRVVGFRPFWKEMVYLLALERGEGARVWDIDGNEYVDWAMGFGALLFGHSPDFIVSALARQTERGLLIGGESPRVGDCARLLCELTGSERATFCNSGTEAVMGAIRLARTVTGRETVAFFTGSYHGWSNEILARPVRSTDGQHRSTAAAPGVPQGAARDALVLEYGSPEALDVIRARAGELAAVLVEPVQSRRPDLVPVEFLRELRAITEQAGCALIFDEVVTGFRVHPRGCQGLFDVRPDLTTYGKALGGGLPVAAIAGKARYLDAIDGGRWKFGDGSYPQAERTFLTGTYHKHPLHFEAVWATLLHLRSEGPELQERLNARTAALADSLNRWFDAQGVAIRTVSFGSLFRFVFPREIPYAEIFLFQMMEQGVYLRGTGNNFLSTAHTEEQILHFEAAVHASIEEMIEGGFIPVPATRTAPQAHVRPRMPPIPTTSAQRDLWVASQISEQAKQAYNESMALHLEGELDRAALERALQDLVARHEILRARFNDDGTAQEIAPALTLDVPFTDAGEAWSGASDEAGIAAWQKAEAARPFDLARGPLVRAALLRKDARRHVLVLTLHHLVTDGWSNAALVEELAQLYAVARSGGAPPPRPAMGFRDYVAWLAEVARSPEAKAAQRYWLARFDGELPVLDLPYDRPRPPARRFAGAVERLILDEALLRDLTRTGGKHGATLFATLLAAFKCLLHRLSGQRDLVVGIVTAGQAAAGVQNLVGYCVNLLPIRTQLEGDPPFVQYLARVRQALLEALDHPQIPFGRILEALNPPRDPGRPPLVNVVFNMDRKPPEGPRLLDIAAAVTPNHAGTSKYDLTVNVTQSPHELVVDVEYDRDLFDATTVRRWLEHFRTLLGAIAARPDGRISTLPLLTAEAERRIAYGWNDTAASYEGPRFIHAWIAEQAARTPDAVAVVFEDQSLTYQELDARANQLAHALRARGVGPEVLVGVSMERSLELVIALVGILKAGGAYVPLDPSYPAERLRYLTEDAKVRLVLGKAEVLASVDQPAHAPEVALSPQNAAYMIYTSGSTGNPKGAINSHEAIRNRLAWMQAQYGLQPGEGVLQKTPFSFDVSVWEFFWPLMVGARLVVARPEGHKELDYLVDVMAKHAITTVHFVPSMLQVFLSYPRAGSCARHLRRVIASGEALGAEQVRRFGEVLPGVALHNLYGPTEAAVDVTHATCDPGSTGGPVPIGKPVANTQIYLLDAQLRPVPVGVAGDLYIGGVQVGRGYHGRAALTAERFIPDPFTKAPGRRLYKSGDVARYLPDGTIEYLGRSDAQVKLRGFRIELGEIEAALLALPAVREAAVLLREDTPGAPRLVAYLAPVRRELAEGGDGAFLVEARRALEERLPAFMVPTAFVVLDALPITPNGKLDRRALAAPEIGAAARKVERAEPRSDAERTLGSIWSDVLGVGPIGLDDNFFDLGGNSIRGIQVVGLAKARGLLFSLQDLFLHQTLRELGGALQEVSARAIAARRAAPFEQVAAEDRAKLPEGVVDAYPLTLLQAGMFFHMRLNPEENVYHNVNSIHLRLPFDREKMQRAILRVVERHPMLRTTFDLDTFREPLQLVSARAHLPLEVVDIRHVTEAEQAQAVRDYVEAEETRRFDFHALPLLRFCVHVRTSETLQLTITDFHPIIDGWALATLLAEMFTHYASLLADGRLAVEAQLDPTFADYVAEERAILASEPARAFWSETLRGASLLTLPRWTAAARRPGALRMESWYEVFPAELTARLHAAEKRMGVPLKAILMAAHVKVMGVTSGKRDVVTGLVADARLEEAGGERVLGLFLNTLPLRLELADGTWTDLARRAHQTMVQMIPHRRYPLAALQREAGGALFETAFNFIDFYNLEAISRSGIAEILESSHAINYTHYTLEANFIKDSDKGTLALRLDHDRNQVCAEQIESIARTYLATLEQIVRDPSARHDHAPLLTREAERRIAYGWNDTAASYEGPRFIHAWIAEQAARTPDAVAVVFENQSLTYQELDARANQLAHALRARGVGPEVLVGVSMERSLELVIALVGILKAGGAYVPLDPSYPAERLRYLTEDAKVRLVLGKAEVLASVDQPAHAPEVALSPQNAAYMIYTSGSTGNPKGAINSHEAIRNRLAWMQAQYGLQPGEGVLQKTPFSFDVSVWEFFWPLMVGARLVVARPEGHKHLDYLVEVIAKQAITTVHFVPSMLQVFLSYPRAGSCARHLRRVIASGEALGAEQVRRFGEVLPGVALHNLYGPTEAAVDVTHATCDPGSTGGLVPIGKPVANTQIYLLDAQLHPVPVGVAGDLYIGGVQVGRGYHGRAALTAERFIPDPFAKAPGRRLYKSGDVARHLPDGTIEYLGRSDAQVKLRGFRIELGEIEAALLALPAVREAAVLLREDAPGGPCLVGYVVPAPEALAEAGESTFLAEARRALEERLPAFMVPTAFVVLDALPITPNGKLDRRALPALETQGDGAPVYEAPSTEIERTLAAQWQRLLGCEAVGRGDDFFARGGHSLSAMQAVSRASAAFDVELSLQTLFEAPTLAGFAERIARTWSASPARDRTAAIVRVARDGDLPLSYAQQRLWFLDQLEPDSAAYVMPGALRVRGALDVETLRRAFGDVVRRHEILRTTFVSRGDQPVQVIAPEIDGALPVEDLSALDAAAREQAMRRHIEGDAGRSFDLRRGPLLRTRLLRLAPEEHVLLVTMHHIVSDGWSLGVLATELGALYDARMNATEKTSTLPELPVQYADFAVWQRAYLNEARLAHHLAYWREQLAHVAPLALPTDHARAVAPAYRGARIDVALSEETTRALKRLCDGQGVTLFMGLMAAFQVLLHRYSGQDDICVGTPIANRSRAELEPLIGLFVNTLAIRGDLSGAPTFLELLARTRQVALAAYAHQDAPFEKVVDAAGAARDLSRNPLFQAMFVLQNEPVPLDTGDLHVEILDSPPATAQFDLSLTLTDHGPTLAGGWDYDRDLFDRATMERMAACFEVLLGAIVERPDRRIGALPMLSSKERAAWLEAQRRIPDETIHVLDEAMEPVPDGVVGHVYTGIAGVRLHRTGKYARSLPGGDLAYVDRNPPAAAGTAAVSTPALEAPATEAERAIAAQWQELLGRKEIGRASGFFALGGHSLSAIQAIARVNTVFGVEVPLRALFERPTLAGFADLVATLVTDAPREAERVPGEARIPKARRDARIPLSFAQQQLWFIDQLEPSSLYNLTAVLELQGPLDVPALQRACDAIVQRHEVLRTTFHQERGIPYQRVHDPAGLPIAHVDLSLLSEEARTRETERLAADAASRPFDLAAGPLVRVLLVRRHEDAHVLVLGMHHIVSDGWSLGRVVQELGALYPAFVQGRPSPLPELPLQFADYAVWQRAYMAGPRLEEHLAYFRRALEGVPVLNLATDFPRPKTRSHRGAALSFALDRALSDAVNALARREGATLFMVLLAAFEIVLGRHAGQDDFAVGVPVAGRSRAEIEPLIGDFVNLVPIRASLGGAPTFVELVARIREASLEAFQHQDVPFDRLVSELVTVRDPARPPLVQAVLVLQNEPMPALDLGGLTVRPIDAPHATAKFDLSMSFAETAADGLQVRVEYSTDLFEERTARRMFEHLRALLEDAVARPTARIEVQKAPCLHDLFAQRAAERPDAPAIRYERTTLTYRELDARANQLAHLLRARGVGPEVTVGLCIERSIEMVIAVLGILKAGGAYVPLDPSSPPERLAFILNDIRARVVITQESLRAQVASGGAETLCIDRDAALLEPYPHTAPASEATPATLAYVIYTSGSTGQPKGVEITHANVLRLFTSTQAWFHFDERDVWTLFHSIAFDFSVWELWGALLHGGRLVVVPYWVSRSPDAFYQLLRDEQITVLNQTPSAFRQLVHTERLAPLPVESLALRWVVFGGEALDLLSLRPWIERHGDQRPRLVNMYGITETTVHVTYRPITADDVQRAPGSVIGAPIPDLSFYILDANMKPVPAGVTGEIYVGGAGVARGYAGRPELTSSRFVPDPFDPRPGARLYRSGDLARYLPDGDVAYIGRSDHQVKIRGFRIELGEIEAAIAQSPRVRESAVLAFGSNEGDARLVAYVVPHQPRDPQDPALTADELGTLLAGKLPAYMVPSAFVLMDALPLTGNGKLDRRALAPPETVGAGALLDQAPAGDIERALAAQWQELLGCREVGRHDDFFKLGGHSLFAVQAIARVEAAFGVQVPLRSLFEQPTLAAFATLIAEAGGVYDPDHDPHEAPASADLEQGVL
ncbi:amino acid adenylation domain-containing protein [Pendulispora albinea]|uniref:Amino acid adenylation domain-containing protein n=1 Tax=Pendulispora albinea TaxID=2741071 RepID=A0ABZ2MA57_9BACT